MIWPAQQLIADGHDINLVLPQARRLQLEVDDTGKVCKVDVPDTDVIVFQRITHSLVTQAIPLIREQGVAVVIDVDDDLSSIHPNNPAWIWLYPGNCGRRKLDGTIHLQSWDNLGKACRDATMVVATTPKLLKRYAPHGRGRVIPNYLPSMYYQYPRTDSDIIVWPASLASHPNDPSATGNAVSRLVSQGHTFRVCGPPRGVGPAFGMSHDPWGTGILSHEDYVRSASLSGIGIIPLADTQFNQAKSWLKGLELSAVGVPWVASPREDYIRLHKLGAGRLAANPKAWYREVKRLCDSANARQELSEAGKEVAAALSIKDNAWRWAEAWAEAWEIQKGSNNVRTEYVRIA